MEYLESIGVNLSKDVKGILITHWHSDHIKGVSKLFKACLKAKLYFSGALLSKEILTVAAMYENDNFTSHDNGIKELSNIIKYIKLRDERNRVSTVKNCHSFFDFRDVDTRLLALSPSDVAVTQSISKLSSLIPKSEQSRLQNIAPENENLNAVAVHFTFGKFSAVLGSDLEETGNTDTGWSAVFSNDIANNQSLTTASIFKVSHHGSSTSYHKNIWSDLLINKPLSITTPFTRSRIPNNNDIEVIKNNSSMFMITQDPDSSKKIKYGNMVDRELRSIAKNRKTINYKMGHIQIRISDSGKYEIGKNHNVVSHSN